MITIREKCLSLLKKIIQACSAYRVTVTAIELFTAYAIIGLMIGESYESNTMLKSPVTEFLFYDWGIAAFFPLFIVAQMFIESLIPYGKQDRKTVCSRVLGLLLNILIACVMVYGIRAEASISVFGIPGDAFGEWCRHFITGYILFLLLMAVYVCHRKSGLDFIEYALHVVVNLAVATAVYFVLLIGINSVILIVNLLFFDGYSSLGGYGAILVTGIYYAPACIMALNNLDNDISDFTGISLVKYVLTGLTVIALAVVYVYLLKILVMWELPSNEIFGIVSGLFWFGMPIWVVAYYYQDETKYMHFLQKVPYGLLPLIPVQAYAMGVRVWHNGLTPSRYMGIFMIVFEIVALFAWRFWKKKLERVLLILAIGITIVIIVPGINMYSMSFRWQKAFLESYYNQVVSHGELTQEEYTRLEGAYQYLKRLPGTEQLIVTYDIYDDEFVRALASTGVEGKNLTQTKRHTIHCCQLVGSLETDGYTSLDMLNQDEKYDVSGEDTLSVDFAAFRFYRRGSGEKDMVTVDISDFANRCIAYEKEHPDAGKEELSDVMRPYIRVEIDKDTVFYMNHFEIRYTDGMKEGKDYFKLSLVNISGVMLSK